MTAHAAVPGFFNRYMVPHRILEFTFIHESFYHACMFHQYRILLRKTENHGCVCRTQLANDMITTVLFQWTVTGMALLFFRYIYILVQYDTLSMLEK